MIAGELFSQSLVKKAVRHIVGYSGLLGEVALTAGVERQSTTRPGLRLLASLGPPKHHLEQHKQHGEPEGYVYMDRIRRLEVQRFALLVAAEEVVAPLACLKIDGRS